MNVFSYIKYFLTAKTKHSAQAPFIYEFITQVLNNKLVNRDLHEIETLRKRLCKSKESIQITDFGAGSQINNSKIRMIKDIAKNSAKNQKFGKLLYRIVKYYKPVNILELGTSLGISTLYLSKGSAESRIFTFEGCPETAKIAQLNFEKLRAENINITLGDFKNTLTDKLNEIQNIDLAFIDGNHRKEATINYFKQCLNYSTESTIFIFDDIHWSKGMESAWDYIKEHRQSTLTIDLFFVGIVFIKSGLSKQDFTIRF